MAFNIYNFDDNHLITPSVIVLCNGARERLACIAHYEDFSPIFTLNNKQEFSFTVHKYADMNLCRCWNDINDLKIIYIPDYHEYYAISVTTNESNFTSKHIVGTSLCEYELSNIYIYTTEINTEEDISREEYTKPTIIYDPIDSKNSLLDRILDKAPHYTIEHVDISLAQKQRSFSIDGVTIYDFLVGELAEELDCLVKFDSEKRAISLYDLNPFCKDCGNKLEDGVTVCPNCKSANTSQGYGEDTTIFISKDNLSQNVSLTANKEYVKNRFRVLGGDEFINATVAACNPNGTNYITYFSDEQRENMSNELNNALDSYDELYNENVDRYQTIMEDIYDRIDKISYLTSEKMPDVELSPDTTAEKEVEKLTASAIGTVAVTDIVKASATTVNSSVLAMAKILVAQGYTVTVSSYSYDKTSQIWTGRFTVTRNNDNTNTATSKGDIRIPVNDDYITFVGQKIERSLASTKETSDVLDPELTLSELKTELKRYCLNRLISFESAYQSCLDILIQLGIGDVKSELYQQFYKTWYDKLIAIQDEIVIVEAEIKSYEKELDNLEQQRDAIQKKLGVESFLGENLWVEYCSHIKEDTYENDNYSSDGLTNSELFERAKELLEVATDELYKASKFQYSISSTISNLLTISEFKKIKKYFKIGNWIRIQVDDEIYKLRLIEIKPSFANKADLEVEFSDVTRLRNGTSDTTSIIKQASSIAKSYPSVKRQAKNGNLSYKNLNSMKQDGISAVEMSIHDSDNQNFIIDEHGLLGRELDDSTNTYSPYQIKIIKDTIVYTNDGWQTTKMALGRMVIDNEEKYGVIADIMISGEIIGTNIVGATITGTIFDNGNGTFSLDENGHLKVSSIEITGGSIQIGDFFVDEEGHNVVVGAFEGTLKTENGNISIFNISSNCLYTESTGFEDENSIYFGTNGLSLGDSFSVTNEGIVKITEGTIADWGISKNGLVDGTIISNDTYDRIQLSNGRLRGLVGENNSFGFEYDSNLEQQYLNFPNNTDDINIFNSFENTLITNGLMYTNGNVISSNLVGQFVNDKLISMYGFTAPLCGDVGHSIIGINGTVQIDFSEEFLSIADTTQKYYVLLTPYSDSQIYASEVAETYFIVSGIDDTEFDWEVKAVQKNKTMIELLDKVDDLVFLT